MTSDDEIPIVLSDGRTTFGTQSTWRKMLELMEARGRRPAGQDVDAIARDLNKNSPGGIKFLLVTSVIISSERMWSSGEEGRNISSTAMQMIMIIARSNKGNGSKLLCQKASCPSCSWHYVVKHKPFETELACTLTSIHTVEEDES